MRSIKSLRTEFHGLVRWEPEDEQSVVADMLQSIPANTVVPQVRKQWLTAQIALRELASFLKKGQKGCGCGRCA
jgi:hypothetical protein